MKYAHTRVFNELQALDLLLPREVGYPPGYTCPQQVAGIPLVRQGNDHKKY